MFFNINNEIGNLKDSNKCRRLNKGDCRFLFIMLFFCVLFVECCFIVIRDFVIR